MNFTFEERNLVCIYSGYGNRLGTIAALEEMRGWLQPDEVELREMTDNAVAKLRRMSDEEYDSLDLFPDFDLEDEEETAYAE